MSIEFAIIGHLAFNKDVTSNGSKTSIGGSAYYCAVGAYLADPSEVGIVSKVGKDFDLLSIKKLNIDASGITVSPKGKTPQFTINQFTDGTRSFEANWGVAKYVNTDTFPFSYSKIRFAHLSTAPPKQYLKWIKKLRSVNANVIISIDTFEEFAKRNFTETHEAIKQSDFVFMNMEEARLLKIDVSKLDKPCVLKLGSEGAIYYNKGEEYYSPAPVVNALETTGAGDILAGSFITLRRQGIDYVKALNIAVSNASRSVMDFGVHHLLK